MAPARTTKIRWHAVNTTIESQSVPWRKRGRQKAGTEPERITHYTVQWHWTGPTAEMIQEARERQSTFVLMTRDKTCDARHIHYRPIRPKTKTNTAFAGRNHPGI